MVAEKIACENSLDFAGSWQIQAKSNSHLNQSQHSNCLRGIGFFYLLCYMKYAIRLVDCNLNGTKFNGKD